MPTRREVVIAGINAALGSDVKHTHAEFTIGNTNIKIDDRGISILLNEEGLDQFALRIHRPNIDVSCWGYVLAGEPGVVMETVTPDESKGFHVVGFMPLKA